MPKGVYPRTPKLSVTCDACGTITMRWKSDVAKGYKATFCSVACRAQYNDAATRFRRNYSPEPNGCWLWTGARYGEGYGSFWMNGKTGLAHRAAYELFVQKPPKSLAVCHRCDNKIIPSIREVCES